MTSTTRPVLVAGGGVAGLTVAAALHRQGIPVEVYERSDDGSGAGGGLNIWSNAMLALRRLGLEEDLRRVSLPLLRSQIWTERGRMLAETPVDTYSNRAGAASVNCGRAELLDVLHRACVNVPVHAAVGTGFRDTGDHVVLRLSDGREVAGSVLLGADGLNSAVRAQLVGDGPPDYLGSTLFRGVGPAPPELPAGVVRSGWGPRDVRTVAWRLANGTASWAVGIAAAAGGREASGEAWRRALELAEQQRGPVAQLVRATDPGTVYRTDLYARTKADVWGAGRVTLLGDAAHAMPTVYGQGACMAIEDGIVLGLELGSGPRGLADPVEALRRYEQARRPRLDWMRGQVFGALRAQGWTAAPLVALRNTVVRHLPERKSARTWEQMLAYPGAAGPEVPRAVP